MVGHRRRLPRRPHLHARGLRQTHFRGVLLGAGLPVERCDRHQASASRPRPRSPAQGIQAAHVPHRRYRSPRRRPAAAPRRTGHASSSGGPPREAAAGESQRLLSRAPYRPPCAGACTTLKSLAEAEIDSWEEADKAPSTLGLSLMQANRIPTRDETPKNAQHWPGTACGMAANNRPRCRGEGHLAPAVVAPVASQPTHGLGQALPIGLDRNDHGTASCGQVPNHAM